eukprot:gnl/MRDRNA2_/MRDRNA2_134178_c0_seq1.p1 gnl/MRDRNA2_/MRDRNA2_134178_c0~~gnl/MRDRNA2_/MRDRNA2_134178_c0_seq1.p1  ORF type:complete len:384 (-),score=97.03 gnl/MRDRNA2_/MRDRNA2_134178_c0_seq1:10-1161(-)
MASEEPAMAPPGSKEEEKPAERPDVNDDEGLRRALEFIFTKDEILKDTVLQFHMDQDLRHMPQDLSVAVTILVVHPKIAAVSGDIDKVIAAAKSSPKLFFNETTQRIGPQASRTMLMIRDFPEDISESDVKELLNQSDWSKDVCSIRTSVISTLKTASFFVTMATEQATLDLALWLRGQKIKDVTVQTSVKSEDYSVTKESVTKWRQHMYVQHQQMAWFQQMAQMQYQQSMAMSAAATLSGKSPAKPGSEGKARKLSSSKSQDLTGITPTNSKKLQQSKTMPARSQPMLSEPGFGAEVEEPEKGIASKRYTRTEIISICKRMPKVDIPPAFAKAGEEQRLLRTEPCLRFELEKGQKAPIQRGKTEASLTLKKSKSNVEKAAEA